MKSTFLYQLVTHLLLDDRHLNETPPLIHNQEKLVENSTRKVPLNNAVIKVAKPGGMLLDTYSSFCDGNKRDERYSHNKLRKRNSLK